MRALDGPAAARLLGQHRRAMRRSVEVVARIRDTQWESPTPCADWDLRGLVEHMILDNRGFAVAAAGEMQDRRVWSDRSFRPDLRAEYADSAELVLESFQNPVGEFWLPRINPAIMYPAQQAMSFHLLDYVLHAWDVAVSIGHGVTFDEDLIDTSREIGDREVLNGANRLRPEAGFRPALEPVAGESTLDGLLRSLGRAPSWPD